MQPASHRKGFTLIELLVVMAILAILIVSGVASFTSAQKKSRDTKRKNDLRQIGLALEAYYNDFNSYPLTDANGTIKGCGAGATGSCTWGSSWKNTTPSPETVYMLTLPTDSVSGYAYYYTTDGAGTYYKLYARLENDKDTDTGVDPNGYDNTNCGGGAKCTYGVASTNVSP